VAGGGESVDFFAETIFFRIAAPLSVIGSTIFYAWLLCLEI
jgi:hypothetical protein